MTILNNILAVSWHEFRVMCTRYSILLVLSGGIFVYGLLYNYMYAPNVVRDAPVAVVDMSRTPLSRSYIRLLDATPQARVLTNNADLPAAKELMKYDEVVGIVYIPADFDARVGRGEEAIYIMYSTTTAFLYFASMQEASAGAMLAVNDDVRPEQVVFLPQDDIQSVVQTRSVDVVGTALYNYTDGYGTYLIPAVLMVVIFQTLIFVISMLSGKERETGDILMFAGPEGRDLSFLRMASVVIGKSFTYLVFYALFSVFLLGLLPLVFQLPHLAYPWKPTHHSTSSSTLPFTLSSDCMSLLYQDIIIHRHYNVRIRAIARARVCVWKDCKLCKFASFPLASSHKRS
jgi:ABC-2 type transport system permease protein